MSGVLSLVALPLLTGRGGAPDNPTADPLAAVLVAIRVARRASVLQR